MALSHDAAKGTLGALAPASLRPSASNLRGGTDDFLPGMHVGGGHSKT